MKNDTIKLLLIFTPALFGSFPALANVSGGDWNPQIVEKMFVLPPQHLNKVLNNDFKTSVLALNLRDTDNKIKSKIDKTILTVKDLTMLKDFSSSFIKKCNPLVNESKINTRRAITMNL